MAQLSFSHIARTDLREIIESLRQNAGSAVALKYTEAFEAHFERLVTHPGIGAPRRKFGADARILIVSPYLIFYDGAPKAVTVTVLRILHESRRITSTMISKGRDDLGG